MSVVLCTLALNEMEWLPRLYEQHKNWPDLRKWVFVESADKVYAEVNPKLVSRLGLSVDGTTEFLTKLSEEDKRVVHIKHGFSKHKDPAQGKCDSRNRYLEEVYDVRPSFIFVLDADEFYTNRAQFHINRLMAIAPIKFTAWCFKHRHPWRPPSILEEPLFKYEVTGGFWDIPLCRGWRYVPGMIYKSNHNTPEVNGKSLDRGMHKLYTSINTPYCVHMAFSSSVEKRHAKNAYYQARGEGRVDHRGWYVESRAAFETWKPGEELPHSAKVISYSGVIPEVFANENQYSSVEKDR